MHEMSLAEGVIQVLEDSARKQDFSVVTRVWLEIGQLSSVEPDAMRFCFDAVSKGTLAEQAELIIIEVPGRGACLACGATFDYRARFDPCPECESYQVQMTGGDEMRVKELEVD